jgi:hypothetical protein
MAAETLRPPVYSARVIIDAVKAQMTPEWYRPIANLFARVLKLSQVAAVGTANATSATASAVSVSSPDATASGAAYNQGVAQTNVTLSNEIKADLNQLVTDFNALVVSHNAMVTLVNDLKAAQNSQSAALNP